MVLEVQPLVTMVTSRRLFVPTQVPQGVLNSTAYFQEILAEGLSNLVERVCLGWVDDMMI